MTGDFQKLVDLDQLQRLVDQLLEDGKPVGFDTESGYGGPDARKRALDHYHPDQFAVGFSFTNDPSWARYVPLRHDNGDNVPDIARTWEIMRPLLTKGLIVSHNSKMEVSVVFKDAGYEIASDGGEIDDTMLDTYVLNEWSGPAKIRPLMDLKGLVKELCDHQMMHIHELWPDLPANASDKIRFNTLDPNDPVVIAYACEDAVWVLPLRDIVSPKAKNERPFMRSLEHRIAKMMREVEAYGAYVDWPAMESAYAQAQLFVPNMEKSVKVGLGEIAGRDIGDLNLNSAIQMKKLLYRDIGLNTTRLTKKGKDDSDMEEWERMSTDEKAMTALAKHYPEIKKLLEYREVQNLSRRLKKWLTEYNQSSDGAVHANYNQVTVGSGRFAANEPAIQQLPKDWLWVTGVGVNPKKEEFKERVATIKANSQNGEQYWAGNFRDFIIARPDHYLLTFDLSQAELRLLAGDAQEPALIRAFADGIDIHTQTAALMLGKTPETLNMKTERPIGKTMNFAILYGLGVKAMAEQLGIEPEEAQALYNKYFSAFTKVGDWMKEVVQRGEALGYAETIFGRKYTVWELQSKERWIQDKGRRVLVNARIQGGVADMMKIGMLRSYTKLKKNGWWGDKCTVTMNQHDSLTFEVHNSLDPNEVRAMLDPLVSFGENVHPALRGYPRFIAEWELGQKWGSSIGWDEGAEATFDGEHWTLASESATIVEDDKEIPEEIDASVRREVVELSPVTTVTVTLDANPAEGNFMWFLDFLKEHPGQNIVKLITPDGVMEMPQRSSISNEHSGEIAYTMGGTMTVDVSENDVRELGKGLGL